MIKSYWKKRRKKSFTDD